MAGTTARRGTVAAYVAGARPGPRPSAGTATRTSEVAPIRLKRPPAPDDTSNVNSSAAAEPAPPSPDPVTTVAGLRERRQALVGQVRHCTHLRRLLRARLDLTVARVLEQASGQVPFDVSGAHPPVSSWSQPSSAVEAVVLQVLAATRADAGPDDLVHRLEGLEQAMRHLGFHVDALQSELDDVTARYVGALGADPAACLAPAG